MKASDHCTSKFFEGTECRPIKLRAHEFVADAFEAWSHGRHRPFMLAVAMLYLIDVGFCVDDRTVSNFLRPYKLEAKRRGLDTGKAMGSQTRQISAKIPATLVDRWDDTIRQTQSPRIARFLWGNAGCYAATLYPFTRALVDRLQVYRLDDDFLEAAHKINGEVGPDLRWGVGNRPVPAEPNPVLSTVGDTPPYGRLRPPVSPE